MAKRINQNRLTGSYPLSYMGVEPSTPPNQTIQNRAPTVNDVSWVIGTIWVVVSPIQIWFLTSLSRGIASWIQLYPNNVSGATSFPTNSGTATEMNGILNVFGTNVISTSGSGNTVDIELVNGGNGQVLIGGGSQPVWKNITSNDKTVKITNGPNTIDLAVMGGESLHQINADTGNAQPVAGVININGGELINTSASGNTVIVNVNNGTNGQIPIASTGHATAYANITSAGGSITVTNGANSIDLEVTNDELPSGIPAFFYYQPTNASPSVGTTYLGAFRTLTKLFDITNNCTTGNGSGTPATFTAPATGTYLLGMGLSPFNLSVTGFIQTPEGNFPIPIPPQSTDTPMGTVLVQLTMSDVVQFGVQVISGSGNVQGGTGTPSWPTYFWGYQVS